MEYSAVIFNLTNGITSKLNELSCPFYKYLFLDIYMQVLLKPTQQVLRGHFLLQ